MAQMDAEAAQSIETPLPLADAPDAEGIHSFSISSAPYEDHLAITTRLRDSPLQRAMRLLTPDDAVEVEGPCGKFVVSAGPSLVRRLFGRDASDG